MEIYDFIDEDEINNAPDDPAQAFSLLVSKAQKKLAKATDQYGTDEWGSQKVSEARHTFQNYIVGLAKAYNIEPFASMEVPDHADDYKQQQRFKVQLDHYMTQLIVSNSLRLKKDSVGIPPKLRDRIVSHLAGLRECIDKADISDARKAGLNSKLDEFEKSLEHRRVNLFALSRLIFEIMSVSANGLALYESPTVRKLASNLMATAAEAKLAEEQQRLPPPDAPAAQISPPNRSPPTDDLDDEIPF